MRIMRNRNRASFLIFVLFAVGMVLTAIGAPASDAKFTSIDVPGAINTNPHDINAEGDIVGTFTDAGNNMHGFVLANEIFNIIDFPGSTMTHIYGLNSRVDVVGEYRDVANKWHGFLLHDGAFTSIDFPGATSTTAWDITAKRMIAGSYNDADGKTHAFLLNKHGEFTELDSAFVHGVNSSGTAVGCWTDAAGTMHSLIVRDGEHITNDFPNSKMSMNWKINENGWMVGYYVDAANITHGYQSKSNRKFATIDFPGATLTDAHGINDSMEIVGRYRDAANKIHGFLLSNN